MAVKTRKGSFQSDVGIDIADRRYIENGLADHRFCGARLKQLLERTHLHMPPVFIKMMKARNTYEITRAGMSAECE